MKNISSIEESKHLEEFLKKIKLKSDRLVNYFIPTFFTVGMLLSYFYDTWEVAAGVGGLSVLAYYSSKILLPETKLYQYVLSTVLGIFMAQYIYQMHGMFEMHFVAFIGSAILITYQDWKLQIPLVLVVVVHHALFGYLQFIGYSQVYFTQLEYMDLQTFVIHVILAAVIFFICGLWAYHFKKYSEQHIHQTFEMGKLQEEMRQRDTLFAMSENLKETNEKLNEAQSIAHLGSWERDIKSGRLKWSDEMFRILEVEPSTFNCHFSSFINAVHPDDRSYVMEAANSYLSDHQPLTYECRVVTPSGSIKSIQVVLKVFKDDTGEVIKTFGIALDITERKAYEQVLEISNTELRKSNLELDKFVYSVSHDLRAPLLSMQGVIDMTAAESAEELTQMNMSMLGESIKRLDNFIAEILEYSRNSRLELKRESIDFNTMLNDISADLKYMNGQNRNVEIKIDLNDTGGFCSDKRRISVLLNNLVSNSIRYSNPDADSPFVKIAINTNAVMAEIEVEDNGIGIPEDLQEKVFEMFYRASESSNGSGLGLYIVKETMDKLKGELRIQSQPGVGTKFNLSIPNLFFQ